MKKMCIIFSFLMIFLCSGCSPSQSISLPKNSISVGLTTFNNGVVIQSVSFPTLEDSFLCSEKESEVYLTRLTQEIEDKIFNNLYLSYWVTYLNDPEEIYVIGGEYVKFIKPTYDQKEKKIDMFFIFGGLGAWKRYHPSSGEKGESQGGNNGLIVTDKSSANFPFSTTDSNGEMVGEFYKKVLKKAIFDVFSVVEIPTISYVYEYKTYQKRLHSNADLRYEKGGLYNHLWEVEEGELADKKEISLWQNKANAGWWYLIVLMVGLAGTGVALGVVRLKRRKRK